MLLALHQRLAVVDLHADSLLWNRNLLRRARYGHADLPRLDEANVALQVYGVVTKVPPGLNFQQNADRGDLIAILAVAQLWPPRTWRSPFERALFEAGKLHRLAARSDGRLRVIRTAADLDRLVAERGGGQRAIGGMLSLEGVHALEGDLASLDALYDAGFRMIGLAHFFDTEAGGSSTGVERIGLTPFGRELVQVIQRKRMVLDLAHSSPRVIDEVLDMAQGPIIVSHTGLQGVADSPRNLSDEHLRRIAATGGLAGVALFEEAAGGPTLEAAARSMAYAAEIAGVEHVALGTDFDGAIPAPVDVTGLPLLTEALIDHGFDEDAIVALLGGNALRVLRGILPPA